MSEGVPTGREARPIQEAESFVALHKGEVLSVLEDPEDRSLVDHISQDPHTPLSEHQEKRFADILEKFETKIFTYEKQDFDKEAKRVLITSDNPGSWSAMKPLITALNQDHRCKGVVAMVSGVAGKDFKNAFPAFAQIRNEKTVLGDALEVAAQEPIDIVVASVSVKNGPEDLALFGGKGNLGASKTYFVFEGYGGVGSAFNLGTTDQMEQIDGIFVNDAFAKALVHKILPEYPEGNIHVTGMLASEGFELPKAEEYRQKTREALNIDADAFTVLYLGDVNSDYAKMPGADPDINTKTFEKTLASIEEVAEAEKGRQVALIVRPHPRDPDKDKLLNAGEHQHLPENLSVKDGSNPIPFNGAVYASDAVVSIISNENMFAPARGRRSIFLSYNDEPGMGGQALEAAYGPKLIEAIKNTPGIFIAFSPQELTEILERISKEPLPQPAGASSVAAGVLDEVLK